MAIHTQPRQPAHVVPQDKDRHGATRADIGKQAQTETSPVDNTPTATLRTTCITIMIGMLTALLGDPSSLVRWAGMLPDSSWIAPVQDAATRIDSAIEAGYVALGWPVPIDALKPLGQEIKADIDQWPYTLISAHGHTVSPPQAHTAS